MDFFNEMDQETLGIAKSLKAPAPTSTDLPELDNAHDRGSQSEVVTKRDQKENLSIGQSLGREPGRIDPSSKSFTEREYMPLGRPALPQVQEPRQLGESASGTPRSAV